MTGHARTVVVQHVESPRPTYTAIVRSPEHVTPEVTGDAVGDIAAQTAMAALQRGESTPEGVWLRLIEIGTSEGWKSASARSFVLRLVKLAASR